MKYYYNIDVDNIIYDNGYYYFDGYVLVQYIKEINFDIYNFFLANKYYIHQIITNIQKSYITVIDDIPYVLLKCNKRDIINFDTIINFYIPVYNTKEVDWSILWSSKVDYYETLFNDIKDPFIRDCFNYYIGLSEVAIRLFKEIKTYPSKCISHYRLNKDIDFLNPINLTIDYRVRDICEYIKKEFFLGNNLFRYITQYIVDNKLNSDECTLILSRLLYPSYFFDYYDLVTNKNDEIKFDELLIFKYEEEIRKLYYLIKLSIPMPRIDWLENKKTQV